MNNGGGDFAPRNNYRRVYVPADDFRIQKAKKAKAVEHPRVELLLLPTYFPKTDFIEWVFRDGHDKGAAVTVAKDQTISLRRGVASLSERTAAVQAVSDLPPGGSDRRRVGA